MLLTEREESRPAEKLALFLTKPFQYLTPTLITTPIDILAKSLISSTLYAPPDDKVEIIDNCKIFSLAKLYDQQQNNSK